MTVLFLNPSAGLGGAERSLLTMTAALRQTHPELRLHVLLLGDGPLAELLNAQGVATSCLCLPSDVARLGDSQFALGVARRKLNLAWQVAAALPGLCGFLRRLRALVRQIRPALIHSNGIKSHVLARLAGLDAVPVLWHIQDFYGARPLARPLLGWAARRMHEALAISEAVATDFRTVAPGRPVEVVPHAIDTNRFRPRSVDAGRLDALAGLPPAPEGTLRVGLVATYARWKGHEVFLNAAARVLAQVQAMKGWQAPADRSVRFYVVGGPIYQTQGSQFSRPELRQLTASLGIDVSVGFVDFQSDPCDIYPALDVVVHASTRPEPFGLTIIEAMASGCAVVASTAGGAAELFTHGQDALGAPPGDVPALADRLLTLLGDADLCRRLGRGARATATRRFDQSRIGGQLVDVYRGVLTRRPGRDRVPSADLPPLFPSPSPTRQLKL